VEWGVAVAHKSIPHRNRSPHGWWIASYLERFEYYDEDRTNLRRRCLAWENTILVKARNRHEAWRKAMAQGRLSEGTRRGMPTRAARVLGASRG
jgi:hypothetical protein